MLTYAAQTSPEHGLSDQVSNASWGCACLQLELSACDRISQDTGTLIPNVNRASEVTGV